MNNKTVHLLFAGLTALTGIAQYATPFIPAPAMPIVLGVVAGATALLHIFFPLGDPTPASPTINH